MKYPKQATFVLLLEFLFIHLSTCFPQTFLNILPENQLSFLKDTVFSGSHRKNLRDRSDYCESWKFTVENNDAAPWKTVPSECVGFVKSYVRGERYLLDSEVVTDLAVTYANWVNVSSDGKDAWVFDVDETLLSNVPYYAEHGWGSEILDGKSFIIWVDLGKAPVLPASLRLYIELKKLGFTIFLLTGRDEIYRNITEKNLRHAGYRNWERLILRGSSDKEKPPSFYKSEKRKELEEEGYRIRGSSGDQWSDLTGYATAQKSFKLPNPLYYVPDNPLYYIPDQGLW